jgi:putative FmdB family regulatory protein
MPIFESYCGQCDVVKEWLGHSDDPEPFCQRCGAETKRLVSTFGVVFTGALSASKYNDPRLEGAHMEEQVVWRTRSSRTGKPERCVLRSFEDRKKYMKDEGLLGIEDVGDIEATSDGKVSSGRGLRGQWV